MTRPFGMRKLVVMVVALGSLTLAAAGCGSDDQSGNYRSGTQKTTSTAQTPKGATSERGPQAAGTSAAKRTAANTTTVKVMKTRYGRILVDGRGRALYLFTREKGASARCYGACANGWPVFFARGNVRAGAGADRHLIGTTSRRDGQRQVTYAGHPLYYYVTDRKPGQVTCQNVDEYGGTWLVVQASGAAVR